MFCYQKHLQLLTGILVATTGLGGCTNEHPETLDAILSRYEQEGVVEFLAPIDPKTGDAMGPPTREAFRFLSSEAEHRFRAELDFEEEVVRYPGVETAGSTTNWICYGESTHSIGTGGLISWDFRTRNDSTRLKRVASVDGRVFHPLSGAVQTCSNGASQSDNTCNVYTTLASGYNSSTGLHRCCERKGTFGSFDCTNTFASSDSL